MKRELAVLFTTILILFIQITVWPMTFFANSGIVLPLVYIITLSMVFPLKTSLFNAFIVGAVQDNLSGGMFVFHLLTTLVLSYIIIQIREKTFRDNVYLSIFLTAAFLVAYIVIYIVWSLLAGYVVYSWINILTDMLVGVFASSIVAYPLHILCKKLYQQTDFS